MKAIVHSEDWNRIEARLLALHAKLLDRDPTAPSDFAEIALPIVKRGLHAANRHLDEEIIWDASTKAILDFCEHPEKWRPDRARILSYLRMAAKADLLNALDSRKRRHHREDLTDPGALSQFASQNDAETSEDDRNEIVSRYADVLSDHRDQEVLRLMLCGIREERPYSEVLGILDLAVLQRREIVKRAKRRIKLKLQKVGRRAE